MWAKAWAVGNVYPRCPRTAPVRASASSTCPQPGCSAVLTCGTAPHPVRVLARRNRAWRASLSSSGQAAQFFQRRHRVLRPIDALDPPGLLGVRQLGGEQAWAVEVQERVEVLAAVRVEAYRFDDRPAPSRPCLPGPKSTISAASQAHSPLECRARLQAPTSLDKTVLAMLSA